MSTILTCDEDSLKAINKSARNLCRDMTEKFHIGKIRCSANDKAGIGLCMDYASNLVNIHNDIIQLMSYISNHADFMLRMNDVCTAPPKIIADTLGVKIQSLTGLSNKFLHVLKDMQTKQVVQTSMPRELFATTESLETLTITPLKSAANLSADYTHKTIFFQLSEIDWKSFNTVLNAYIKRDKKIQQALYKIIAIYSNAYGPVYDCAEECIEIENILRGATRSLREYEYVTKAEQNNLLAGIMTAKEMYKDVQRSIEMLRLETIREYPTLDANMPIIAKLITISDSDEEFEKLQAYTENAVQCLTTGEKAYK